MKIDLLPEDEKLIADKLASGMYMTRSEVVRDALRQLAACDQLIAQRGSAGLPPLPAKLKARRTKRRQH